MDALSTCITVWGIVDMVEKISKVVDKILTLASPTVKQHTTRSELCEFQANLRKIQPALASLRPDSTQASSDKFSYLVIILRNSESTARDLFDLLPPTYDGVNEQLGVENLFLSVKMMSAAFNQLRLELFHSHPSECHTILPTLPDDRKDLECLPCRERRSPTCEPESLEQNVDDWVVLTLQDCPPDWGQRAAEELSERHAENRSALSHIASVVSKVSSYLSRDRRKRGLHNEVKLATFDTPKEYIDCAAWFLEQARCSSIRNEGAMKSRRRIRPHSPKRRRMSFQETLPADKMTTPFMKPVFPEHPGQKYFSIRAACCVRASFRPLTIKELFFATTTKISPKDHEWPFVTTDGNSSIAELIHICSDFLRVDDKGSVHFHNDCKDSFLAENGPIPHQEAHLFMSLMCLRQMKRQPRLILKPWLDYHNLQAKEEHFPLHKYVVSFWQSHCRAAEGISTKVPSELHVVIQAAWLSERGAECLLASDSAMKDLDTLLVQGEALDIGLELSIAHGFSELATSYRKMGAKPAEENTFDFRDWILVEPSGEPKVKSQELHQTVTPYLSFEVGEPATT